MPTTELTRPGVAEIDDVQARRRAARIAGLGYVAIFVLAIFANFVVRESLVHPGDAAATAADVAASESLFRGGLAAFVVVFLIDVPIAWALYVLFRPAGRDRSLLAAWFRLVYTVMLGVAAVFMFLGLQLVTGGPGTGTMGPEAGLLMFEAFDYAWLVGLFAFGVHLVLLGRMIVASRIAPVWLGWTLIVAGVAYGLDTMAVTLVADYAAIADVMLMVVLIPSVVAELSFTAWLLVTGWRRPRVAAETA
ncbi:DUF4386 domain-containing protein [Agromyces sp. GXQ0307]|uniref:DUF4386 domain-containing protein n=1 Tax=Agromyces sp. GXQ0307 TaxID=3377835 RepID=UPI00383B4C63